MKRIKNSLKNNLKTQVLKTENEALVDLILGILILGVLVILVGLFAVPQKPSFVLGVLLGMAGSVGRAVHMAVTLERQLDYGEKDASAYAWRSYMLRYVSMIIVLLAAIRVGKVCMAGAVIGLFLMKPAAVLAPQIHRYIYTRIFDKGR